MDKNRIITDNTDTIKKEYLSSDDEFDFQFEVSEEEYMSILKELRPNDKKKDFEEDDDIIEISYQCPEPGCKRSKGFKKKSYLLKHLKLHQKNGDIDRGDATICYVCGKSFKGRLSAHLKKHSQEKSPNNFSCELCGKDFDLKHKLLRHQTSHGGEKPFQCSWCGKKFRAQKNLDYHMNSRHIGTKGFVCNLCGKEFRKAALLSKHALSHGTDNPWKCIICKMSFKHQPSLVRHSKIHQTVSQCIFCNKKFDYESLLKVHIMTDHKDVDIANQPRPVPQIKMSKKSSRHAVEHHQSSESIYYENNFAPVITKSITHPYNDVLELELK